ncbi:MAG TPA: SCP2 sterol-binding domain-containing protein [Myxococcota bacterium]|nr:SCP2 sterol-binding domain-containing protein [Myxococcota bacterium]HRY97134.1 SCP2 sterol-binding domain-containing protein [Myxococcota bacterium]
MQAVREIFENMPATFIQEKAVGLSAVVQFDVTGEGGGKWTVAIDDGRLSVLEGAPRPPQVTFTVSAADYLEISAGRLSGQLAFMTGRLKAVGDLRLAMKMQSLFRAPAR